MGFLPCRILERHRSLGVPFSRISTIFTGFRRSGSVPGHILRSGSQVGRYVQGASFQIANDGQLANVRLLEDNRTFTFPTIAEGVESVYYLTAPVLANGDSYWGCGPGCNNVKVLESAAGPPVDGSFVNGSSTAFFFYDCNITITVPSPDVPPVRAAQAAQAIALSG